MPVAAFDVVKDRPLETLRSGAPMAQWQPLADENSKKFAIARRHHSGPWAPPTVPFFRRVLPGRLDSGPANGATVACDRKTGLL
jgi:hypothetical protein